MAMKEWVRRLQPVQLYVMVILTALYFLTQLVMSHMTHALTLLVDSCHMLCNLIALMGCIVTIKKSQVTLGVASISNAPCTGNPAQLVYDEPSNTSKAVVTHQTMSSCTSHSGHTHGSTVPSAGERRLRNTFGWARIDVLVTLICCVFLASLCFSLCVEALQTLVHIDQHDEMHHPIPVMCVGALGILINGVCYLMIGGYTFHQGSFLHMTESGDVVLDHSKSKTASNPSRQGFQHQPTSLGAREMCRDVIGCVLVIICSVLVYWTDEAVAKYVDPVMAIISAILLLTLSYPYMKESGLILLQTIPEHINIHEIRKKLLKEFPDVVNVHELHVWQLTSSKVFSTAHIIFLSPQDYTRITEKITDFFYSHGITQVTIQPEFLKAGDDNVSLSAVPSLEENECLVSCHGELCHGQHCCSHTTPEDLLAAISIGHGHSHTHSGHSHSDHSHSDPTHTELTSTSDTNTSHGRSVVNC